MKKLLAIFLAFPFFLTGCGLFVSEGSTEEPNAVALFDESGNLAHWDVISGDSEILIEEQSNKLLSGRVLLKESPDDSVSRAGFHYNLTNPDNSFADLSKLSEGLCVSYQSDFDMIVQLVLGNESDSYRTDYPYVNMKKSVQDVKTRCETWERFIWTKAQSAGDVAKAAKSVYSIRMYFVGHPGEEGSFGIRHIKKYDKALDTATVEVESSSSKEIEEESSSSEDVVDDEIIYLYEDFDGKYDYDVNFLDGYSGRAGYFAYGDMMELHALDDSIPVGSFEFYFKPADGFDSLGNVALVGSDEGRMTFQMIDGNIYFFKNLPDEKKYVASDVALKSGWNRIVAQWDGQYMSLIINDTEMKRVAESTGYSPSVRSASSAAYGNAILVGYKSACCTIGAKNVYSMGSFDNIKITSKLLYP